MPWPDAWLGPSRDVNPEDTAFGPYQPFAVGTPESDATGIISQDAGAGVFLANMASDPIGQIILQILGSTGGVIYVSTEDDGSTSSLTDDLNDSDNMGGVSHWEVTKGPNGEPILSGTVIIDQDSIARADTWAEGADTDPAEVIIHEFGHGLEALWGILSPLKAQSILTGNTNLLDSTSESIANFIEDLYRNSIGLNNGVLNPDNYYQDLRSGRWMYNPGHPR